MAGKFASMSVVALMPLFSVTGIASCGDRRSPRSGSSFQASDRDAKASQARDNRSKAHGLFSSRFTP